MLYLFLFSAFCMFLVSFVKGSTKFDKANTLPLRGVLALLIILHHVSQSLTYMIPEDSPVNILKDFDAWGGPVVSVFFFLSGYGLMTSYVRKGAIYLDGFLKKRLLKILIPFLLCSLLYSLYNPWNLSNLLAIETWKCDCPLLPASWYVVIILIEYLAFYFIAKTFTSPNRIIVGMFIFSILLFILLKIEGFKPYWWQTLMAMPVGMIVSQNENLFEKRILPKSSILVSFIVLSLLYLVPYFESYDTLGMGLSRTILLPVFIWQVIRHCGFPKISVLNFLGSISYEIYLVQSAVLIILFGYIGGHPILFFLSVYAGSILLAYMIHLFLQRVIFKFL